MSQSVTVVYYLITLKLCHSLLLWFTIRILCVTVCCCILLLGYFVSQSVAVFTIRLLCVTVCCCILLLGYFVSQSVAVFYYKVTLCHSLLLYFTI